MRKIVLILFFILLTSFVISASSKFGIMINPQTNECTKFWSEDKSDESYLQEGWGAYYPDNNDIINTEYGKCNYNKGYQSCCNELGLNLIAKNEGPPLDDIIWSGHRLRAIPIVAWIITSLIILVIIVYFFKRKNKK